MSKMHKKHPTQLVDKNTQYKTHLQTHKQGDLLFPFLSGCVVKMDTDTVSVLANLVAPTQHQRTETPTAAIITGSSLKAKFCTVCGTRNNGSKYCGTCGKEQL